ncbi:MAG TPA: sulfurtransferase TusA family protein [Ktedonobacterales bacterium]
MTSAIHSDITVDARGQMCPMPILSLARVIRDMAPGGVVEILATDAGAKADIPAWCEKTGNEFISGSADNGVLTFYVRKSA